MSEGKGAGGSALEEAVIKLRYKILGEAAYKRFDTAMTKISRRGGAQKTVNIKVSVNSRALTTLQKKLDRLAKSVRVSVGVDAAPLKGRAARQPRQSQSGNDFVGPPKPIAQRVADAAKAGARKVSEFVGPPRPIPINWPNRASDFVGPPKPSAQRIEKPSSGVTITVDQIKELGSAARAAAEAIRQNARNAARGLTGEQQRTAFDGFNRSSRTSQNRLDPYGHDVNSDIAHGVGSFSGLRFNPAAPDMSRMSFSHIPTPAPPSSLGASALSAVRRIKIPRPDISAFKGALDSMRSMVGRAGEAMQRKLELTPKIKTGGMKAGLQDAMTQLGVGTLAVGIGHVFDEAQHLEDQIRALTPSIAEATEAQKGLFAASKDTNSSYKTAVDIYSALAVMKDKTKLDSSQAVEVVRSLQAASQIGGGSAAGQERAIAQVEKAIAMDKLTIIGLNSIERQSRGITVAVAEGLGKTVPELRKLAHEGKIGAKELSDALLKMAPEMQRRLGNVRVTFGNLRNYANTVMLEWATKLSDNWDGWGKGMQKIRDAMAGLNNFMSGAFDKLVGYLGSGKQAAKGVQFAFMALGGGAVLAAVWAFGGAVLAALWPVVVAAGAVLAAILAVDDVLHWVAGKGSVMGDMVGPFKNFKPVFDDISKSFSDLGKAWGSLWGGDDGMADALNQGEEPPLAKSFRSMLESVKELVDNIKEMLRLLKALQDGDYDSASKIGGNIVKNGLVSGGHAEGLTWNETALYSLYGDRPRDDPYFGWWIRSTDWLRGTQTLPLDQRKAQIDEWRAGGSGSSSVTNNPTVNIYAQTNDPAEIGKQAAGAITDALKPPMLPNTERGPR